MIIFAAMTSDRSEVKNANIPAQMLGIPVSGDLVAIGQLLSVAAPTKAPRHFDNVHPTVSNLAKSHVSALYFY